MPHPAYRPALPSIFFCLFPFPEHESRLASRDEFEDDVEAFAVFVHPGRADLCPKAPLAFFTGLAHALDGVDNVGRLLLCHKMCNKDTDNTPIVRRMCGEAKRPAAVWVRTYTTDFLVASV
jgi:hypothetical protein